ELSDDQARSFGGKVRGLLGGLRERDFQSLLGNSRTFTHLLIEFDRFRPTFFSEIPKFVIARTADMGIFKVVRADEQVVSGDQVHYPQESGRRYITGEALNHA